MPVINKVRIVNFAYNNDNRLIPDSTFDLRSEDGLITLRNGGGKSIMAQVIMQPMIPMGSLGHNAKKRTFDKIFRKDQEPCYVLIEWKLDNNAGYMTNGVAFKRINNSEEETPKSNIDYYTFILDRANCDLNITNLKLSSINGSSINIKDYYEVKSHIESHGGKVYKKDSEFYKNNLMTYNIYPKEWKSIIAKINGDEGGLLKLFENSITSKDLTENWIVKTIKEALESSTNINELSEQTENHIGKARRRIEDRKNREILGKYMSTLQGFKGVVAALNDIHEKIKLSKESMYNLKYTLSEHNRAQEFSVGDLNKELLTIEENLGELKVQSTSKKYYEVEKEKNKLSEERAKIGAELKAKKREFEDKKKLLTSLKVAAIKEDGKRAEIELAEYEAKIDKLSMEEKDMDVELRNLGYTINSIYAVEKENFEKELSNFEIFLGEAISKVEGLKEALNKNTIEQKTIVEEAMKLQGKVNYLSENIEGLLHKVENTNLFLATNEDEIEKEINVLREAVKRLNKDLIDNDVALRILQGEKVGNNNKLEDLSKEIGDLNAQKLLKEKEFLEYKKSIAILHDKLNRVNVEFSIKSRVAALSKLKGMAEDLEYTINKAMIEKQEKEVSLERLFSGGIEVNKKFISFLEEKSIAYTLGADYIKTSLSSESARGELIKRVPILPYAVILEKSNIDYLRSDMPEEFYENLTLIIEREELNSIELKAKAGVVDFSQGIRLLALYNEDLVVKEDLEGEKSTLRDVILAVEDKISLWKQQLNMINILINEVENLPFENDHEEKLKKEIHDLENTIDSLSYSLDQTKNKIGEIDKDIKSLEEKKFHLNDNIRTNELNVEVFNELRVKVIDRKTSYRSLDKLKSELKIKEELINHEEKKLNELNSSISEIKFKKMSTEKDYKYLKEKQLEFIGYEDGNLINGELESLRSRYFSLKQNSVSGDLNEYKNKAAKCREIIKNSNDKLCDFENEEYEKVKYDFTLERMTEKERNALGESINRLSSEEAVLKKDISTKVETMENIIISLAPNKLKLESEIENNLKEKEKSILNRQEVVKISISNLQKDIDHCRKIEDRINDNIWFDLKEYNLSKKYYNEEYLKDKVSVYEKTNDTLKELNQKSDKSKEEIKNSFIDIKKEFKNINQTIDISLKTFEREIEKQITHEISGLIDKQVSLLEVTLKKLATDLEILDTEQSQIINSYLDVAKQYTDELLKIDKNSVLSIEKTRRKMMMIDKLNYDEVASPRILTLYLQETLNTLINSVNIESDSLSKAISKEFSVESLLEHYCDLNNVVVKFYKVEEHISFSDYKKWEEMLPDNSGGEKFVSFFVLLATLINYSRGNHLKKNASSMSIIMDNPFAAISSQHLLIPLFEYAKQNNIQLICFSDHDKVDIVDRFNTIIRLAITPLTNKKEVIEAETMRKDVRYEEQIDEGYYNYSEQMSLI